ncbi:MAG TPA: glycosyltransferase family 2 protein [Chitinophagales bacterium]|nr:glycosyltransferase family 2 protein [Chitinophagales bacterium]
MSHPSVAIVILNYNGKKWLEQFLPSVIEHNTYPNAEIIIADNASTDDSIAFLKAYYPQIRLVINEKNTGYAGGYNEALKQVEADYYVLLNSDVEVSSSWIEHLVQFMEDDKTYVACQPKILSFHEKNKFEYAGAAGGFIDKYGYPFCRGRIFDSCEIDTGQYNTSGEIFWASGACMFIRADLFHLVGGFDADFFAHMEEIDLCWRLKNLGYKIGYCAESTVYHVGGGTLNKSNPKKTYLNFRNNRKLLRKNLTENELKAIYNRRNQLDQLAALVALAKGNTDEANAIRQGLNDYKESIHKWDKKRTENERLQETMSIGKPNKVGIFNHSIVWKYFVNGNKKFSDLKF